MHGLPFVGGCVHKADALVKAVQRAQQEAVVRLFGCLAQEIPLQLAHHQFRPAHNLRENGTFTLTKVALSNPNILTGEQFPPHKSSLREWGHLR